MPTILSSPTTSLSPCERGRGPAEGREGEGAAAPPHPRSAARLASSPTRGEGPDATGLAREPRQPVVDRHHVACQDATAEAGAVLTLAPDLRAHRLAREDRRREARLHAGEPRRVV